jgi:formylglycine-generating enzyme required for sulfatase activity
VQPWLALCLREGIGLAVRRAAWVVAAIAVASLTTGPPALSDAESASRVSGVEGAIGQDAPLPDFVEVPGGPFVMGADPARDPQAYDNERWSRESGEGVVDMPLFYVARHEITVAQFSAFVRATGWKADPQALAGPPAHPVAFVTWPDAIAYCRWLEPALKNSPSTPGDLRQRLSEGWRVSLPTEAEWEKAARGTDRRTYPWGNEPRRDRANYGNTGTTPVGQLACPECPYGLADMSGNVWEWTRSPSQPYPYDPNDDRTNLDADALWVMRGGHYGDGPRNVRTTTRGAADPGARRAFIGFRVAVSTASRASSRQSPW